MLPQVPVRATLCSEPGCNTSKGNSKLIRVCSKTEFEGMNLPLTSSVPVSHVIPVVYSLDLKYLYCILVLSSKYTCARFLTCFGLLECWKFWLSSTFLFVTNLLSTLYSLSHVLFPETLLTLKLLKLVIYFHTNTVS
jgi:hypothetical protein